MKDRESFPTEGKRITLFVESLDDSFDGELFNKRSDDIEKQPHFDGETDLKKTDQNEGQEPKKESDPIAGTNPVSPTVITQEKGEERGNKIDRPKSKAKVEDEQSSSEYDSSDDVSSVAHSSEEQQSDSEKEPPKYEDDDEENYDMVLMRVPKKHNYSGLPEVDIDNDNCIPLARVYSNKPEDLDGKLL